MASRAERMKHGLRLYSVQFDGMPVFVLARDFAEAIALWRRGLLLEDPESWTEEEASTVQPESVTHLAEPGDVNLLALPPDPPSGSDTISQEAWAPCAHSVPQGADQLRGICVFCYRDRLGAALREIRRLSDPPSGDAKLLELRKWATELQSNGFNAGRLIAMELENRIDRLLASDPAQEPTLPRRTPKFTFKDEDEQ